MMGKAEVEKLFREAVGHQTVLVYVGRDTSMPFTVSAKVSWTHPSHDITYRITDAAWLERMGWAPSSHVEVQASPFPQTPSQDTYYWQHTITGPDE